MKVNKLVFQRKYGKNLFFGSRKMIERKNEGKWGGKIGWENWMGKGGMWASDFRGAPSEFVHLLFSREGGVLGKFS